MGWGPEQHALANLYDLVSGAFHGLAKKRMPKSAHYPRPAAPVSNVTSLADFNAEAFIRNLSR